MALVDTAHLAGPALLAAVCVLVFAESGLLVGFWLPGDVVLFPAGLATAAPSVHLSPWLLAFSAGTCAIVGYEVGYRIGRRWGRPVLLRRAGKRLGAGALDRADAFMHRYGAVALISARFMPWARTLVPLLGGATLVRHRTFTICNVVGGLCWATGLILLGRLSADAPGLEHAAAIVAGVIVVAAFAVPGTLELRRRRRLAQEGSD